MREIKIAPSILSADFADIGVAIKDIINSKADMIHCDVMDGLFVPNISFGPKMIADIRKRTEIILDAHLMIIDPIRYIEQFAKAGADIITVHVEACKDKDIICTLNSIKQLGKKCGAVISPDTNVSVLENVIDHCDVILLMSVYPGFSGQSFLPKSITRLKELKKLVGTKNIDIQIDGGVTTDNIEEIIKSGANIIVAGNTFFASNDKFKTVQALKNAIK